MRQTLRALFFGVFSIVPSASAEVAPAPQPKLTIVAPTFDFGTVAEGEVVETSFSIRNDGDAPLEIKRVQPACGCTGAVLDATTLPPGAASTLRVTFNTTGFAGEKVKTVRLLTNEAEQSKSVVSLRGTVQPEVIVEPQRLYFGEIRRGAVAPRSVNILFPRDSGISVTGAGSRSEKISVALADVSAGDKVGKELRVSLADDIPIGIFRGRVVVRTTSKRIPVVNVNVVANVIGDIILTPTEVSYGLLEAPLKAPLERTVQLAVSGLERVLVTAVESDNDSVSATLRTVEEGRRYDVLVVLREGANGVVRARLRLTTDHPDPAQKTLELPVYAIVTKKGE